MQMIADAVAAVEAAPNRQAESSTEGDSKGNGTNLAAASGSSANSEMAVESSPGMHEVNTVPTVKSTAILPPIELGSTGIDLSPYVLCELTLPTSPVQPRVHANEETPPLSPSMRRDTREEACVVGLTEAIRREDSQANDTETSRPAAWPTLVNAYLGNVGRGGKLNAQLAF